jgi:uncharacterized protein YggU (UPF0235/DUF167 family)
MTRMQEWVRHAPGGCTVTVRVTPRASRPGIRRGAGGIAVAVSAPPEGSRANEEARRRLAGALGVPPTAVRLLRGARGRVKTFAVTGPSASEAAARLGAAG